MHRPIFCRVCVLDSLCESVFVPGNKYEKNAQIVQSIVTSWAQSPSYESLSPPNLLDSISAAILVNVCHDYPYAITITIPNSIPILIPIPIPITGPV